MQLIKPIFILLYSCSTLTSYCYREIEEPIIQLKPNIRIIQYSAPRTGSTLIYNILKYLFESKEQSSDKTINIVNKTHNTALISELEALRYDVHVFSTLRNVHGQARSRLLIRTESINNQLTSKELLRAKSRNRKLLRFALNHDQCTLLFYSLFIKDYNNIYDNIERNLNVIISEKARNDMNQYFSFEALNDIADRYSLFSDIDPDTNIHGKHFSKK